MKKYFALFALAAITPFSAMATQLEYGAWSQSASGSATGTVNQSYPNTSSTQQIIAGEIGMPLLPDLRFSNTTMFMGSGGTTMEVNHTDIILFMPVLDNYVSLRGGVGASLYQVNLNAGALVLPIPDAIGYLGASFNPIDSLSVGVDFTKSLGLLPGVNTSTMDYYVSYKALGPLGVKAGVRTTDFNVSQGGEAVSFSGNGAYLTVMMKF